MYHQVACVSTGLAKGALRRVVHTPVNAAAETDAGNGPPDQILVGLVFDSWECGGSLSLAEAESHEQDPCLTRGVSEIRRAFGQI